MHHDVFSACALGRLHRVASEILTIRDENDDLLVGRRLRISSEELACRLHRSGNGRSPNRHVVWLELTEELGDGSTVTGERKAHRFTSEGNCAESRAGQARYESTDLRLGAVDTRRADVASIHALGEVERDHDVQVRSGNGTSAAAVLWLSERHETKGHRNDQERTLECAPPAAVIRKQRAYPRFIAEAL